MVPRLAAGLQGFWSQSGPELVTKKKARSWTIFKHFVFLTIKMVMLLRMIRIYVTFRNNTLTNGIKK